MLFSSTIFLFIFLPLVLIIYYGFTKKQHTRNIVLLISSLFFYAWGEPRFVLIMIVSIGANYTFGRLVHRYRKQRKAKYYLTVMVIFNLLIMGIFKYLSFILENLQQVGIWKGHVPQIALPIGISFFTFQSISYVIDVYRGQGKVLKNPLNVGLYIAFFPQLIAGPIVRYETVAREIRRRKATEADFASGIVRFIIGIGKKVLLSNQLALVADKAFELHQHQQLTMGFAWLGAISYMLQIYFDFGGYSDMAIGLGRMFGFHFNENFNYPYAAKSITEFWRRWHISLSSWFRDYVYIPLGGNRVNKLKQARNIFVVWLLTGIWHGANWTFMVWGIYFGILLLIEKFTYLGKYLERTKLMGHIYTLLLVLISWVIFRADHLSLAFSYIKHMLGEAQQGIVNDLTLLYLKENMSILIIASIASLPFSKKIKAWLDKKSIGIQRIAQFIGLCGLAGIFLMAIAALVKGTYNPFIYFNF